MFFNYKTLLAALTSSALIGSVVAYEGKATFFAPGLGACGKTNKASDHIVALNTAQYDKGAHCFKSINVKYGSKHVTAQVVDECTGCEQNGIDLSPSAFDELAAASVGEIEVEWSFT